MNEAIFHVNRLLADLTLNAPPTALADPQKGQVNASVGLFANQILVLILAFAVPVGVLGLMWVAYQLLTSNGKPDAMNHLKKYLGYLTIGILLLIGSLVIVRAYVRLALS
jgi:hypothetical protein